MSSFGNNGLFGGLFGHGAADVGDRAWLQAMLDTEAALARALERAGLADPGTGARSRRSRGRIVLTSRNWAARRPAPGIRCPRWCGT